MTACNATKITQEVNVQHSVNNVQNVLDGITIQKHVKEQEAHQRIVAVDQMQDVVIMLEIRMCTLLTRNDSFSIH